MISSSKDDTLRRHAMMSKDPMQSELQNKLKERHRNGLTTDITPEGSDDEGFLGEYNKPRRDNRPTSAHPSHRPTGSDRFSTWQPSSNYNDDDDEMANLYQKSLKGGNTWQSGSSGKKSTSPLSGLLGKKTPTQSQSPSTGLFGNKTPESKNKSPGLFGKKTPPPSLLPQTGLYGQTSPQDSQSKGKGGLFGKKTPPPDSRLPASDKYGRPIAQSRDRNSYGEQEDQYGNKLPWQPPNLRKASSADLSADSPREQHSDSPGLKGRKTPSQDISLEHISDSGTPRNQPTPRSRLSKYGSNEDLKNTGSPRGQTTPRLEKDDRRRAGTSPSHRLDKPGHDDDRRRGDKSPAGRFDRDGTGRRKGDISPDDRFDRDRYGGNRRQDNKSPEDRFDRDRYGGSRKQDSKSPNERLDRDKYGGSRRKDGKSPNERLDRERDRIGRQNGSRSPDDRDRQRPGSVSPDGRLDRARGGSQRRGSVSPTGRQDKQRPGDDRRRDSKSPAGNGAKFPRFQKRGGVDPGDRPTPKPRKGDADPVPERRRSKALTSDIFGKTSKGSLNSDDEDDDTREEKNFITRNKNATARTAAGRKTPTNKSGTRSPTPKKELEQDDNKRKSILDFLTDEPSKKEKTPKDTQKGRVSPVRRKSSGSKTPEPSEGFRSRKNGSKVDRRAKTPEKEFFREGSFERQKSQSSFDRHKTQSPFSENQRRTDGDDSSICLEYEKEPNENRRRPEKEGVAERQQERSGKSRAETQKYDDAIDQVLDCQESGTMKFIAPDKEAKTSKKSEDVMKKHKPKPRYAKPGSAASTPVSEPTFDNAESIRKAIFDEWYKEKQIKLIVTVKEKKKAETDAEQKKKKDEEYKKLESAAAYQSWASKKKEVLGDKKTIENEEKKKAERKKWDDEEQKRKDAEKTFKKWKEEKDEIKIHTAREKKREVFSKTRDEDKEKRDKKKLSHKEYIKWKNKKDMQIMRTDQEKKYQKLEETKTISADRKTKDKTAHQKYQDWMEKKEEQQMQEKTAKRHQKQLLEWGDIEPTPPWCPAKKNIPFGR